jgi:hypothetical protein
MSHLVGEFALCLNCFVVFLWVGGVLRGLIGCGELLLSLGFLESMLCL